MGDFYPDDSHIAAETARNRGALLLLIDRAGCPYAAISTARLAQDCGAMYDDFRDEPRPGWRTRPVRTIATGGRWRRPATLMATYAGGCSLLGPSRLGPMLVTGKGRQAPTERERHRRRHRRSAPRPIALPADPRRSAS